MVSAGNVDLAARDELLDFEVPVHQGPHVVLAFAHKDVVDHLSNWAFWDTSEISTVFFLWLRAHDDPLVLPVNGVPAVLVFLGEDEADRVDWRVDFLNPAKNDGDGPDASVLLVSLKLGLGG